MSFHSPMDDVIGVRIEHHRGGVDRGPSFALTRTAADVKVVEADDAADGVATFRSGALTARDLHARRRGTWSSRRTARC